MKNNYSVKNYYWQIYFLIVFYMQDIFLKWCPAKNLSTLLVKGRLTISFHTTTLLQKRAIPIFYDAFDLKQPIHLQLTIDHFSLDENYLLCGVGGYGDNSEAVLSPSPFSPRKKPEEICGATLAFSVDA